MERRRFTREFKIEAVKLVREPGFGKRLTISSSSIRSASIATCDGPLGATQPYSVRCPRIALMSWVRCRTNRRCQRRLLRQLHR